MRKLEEIHADILAVEREAEGLLAQILGMIPNGLTQREEPGA